MIAPTERDPASVVSEAPSIGSLQQDRELLVSAFAEALERADDRLEDEDLEDEDQHPVMHSLPPRERLPYVQAIKPTRVVGYLQSG